MQTTKSLYSRLSDRLTHNSIVRHSHNKDLYADADIADRAEKQQQHSENSYRYQFTINSESRQWSRSINSLCTTFRNQCMKEELKLTHNNVHDWWQMQIQHC